MRVAAGVGFTIVKLRVPVQVCASPSFRQRLPEAPFANKWWCWESHMALCSHALGCSEAYSRIVLLIGGYSCMCRLCLPEIVRTHCSVSRMAPHCCALPEPTCRMHRAPIYSPGLRVPCRLRNVVAVARLSFCWSDSKSCSSWRCRFSARNEIRHLQVLHNIRLSSALFSASRSIESCSTIVSRSPPVLTVLHSAHVCAVTCRRPRACGQRFVSGRLYFRFDDALPVLLLLLVRGPFVGHSWAIFAVWGSAVAPTICCIVRGALSGAMCIRTTL